MIDEEDARRSYLMEVLGAAGYEVDGATDGPDGLRAFRENPPGVVVIDLEMPETDGLDTLRRLRLLDPFAAFVGLTDLFLEDADRLGVAVALSPGCPPEELVRGVETAIERTLAEISD